MSTPDKCPHCGADYVGNHGEGWFSCGSHRSHKEPSPLCCERAANAATRRDRDTWYSRAEAFKQAAELAELEAKKAEDALAREREKWRKLMEWASDKFWKHRSIVIKEMNRLDAEAKGGR